MPGLPLTLVYDAPAECPQQHVLQTAVENLVANEPARPLSARITIRQVGESYEATIASPGGSPRVLRGSTCSEVVEATSVVLALSITPKGPDSAPPKDAAAPPKSPKRRSSATPTRWLLGASARADVGTLPLATLGFGGQLGLEQGAWSLRALGTYYMDQRGTLPDAPALGGDFAWWTGALRGCGAPTTGTLRVELCAGAELGVLSGQGFGPTQGVAPTLESPRLRSTPWAAASAELAANWQITGGLRLRTSLGLAFPFVGRRAFDIVGQKVHEPSAVAGRAEIGPEVVF